jgi:hypothetical protein
MQDTSVIHSYLKTPLKLRILLEILFITTNKWQKTSGGGNEGQGVPGVELKRREGKEYNEQSSECSARTSHSTHGTPCPSFW